MYSYVAVTYANYIVFLSLYIIYIYLFVYFFIYYVDAATSHYKYDILRRYHGTISVRS